MANGQKPQQDPRIPVRANRNQGPGYGKPGSGTISPGPNMGFLQPSGSRQGAQYPYHYAGDPNLELIAQAGQRGGGFQDIMGGILEGFSGNASHIPGFFKNFAPFIMAQLLQTDAAKDLMDTDRLSQLAYAPVASNIEQQRAMTMRGVRGALAQSGMAHSGALPHMEAQLGMQAAGQKGSILNNLILQQLMQRWNMTRDVAGMGLGLPGATAGGGGGNIDWGSLLSGAGSAAGGIAGLI